MRAAVFHGPRDIRLEDVEEREPGPGEELPVTLGHEFAGTVRAVGGDVEGVSEGDAVAIEPVLRCGACAACRAGAVNLCDKLGFYGLAGGGGGLSESAVVPGYTVHALPEGIDTEQGALVEPIAVGLRAVRRAGVQAGQSALVLGAGPIGAVTLLCLKAAGASPILVAEVATPARRRPQSSVRTPCWTHRRRTSRRACASSRAAWASTTPSTRPGSRRRCGRPSRPPARTGP